MCSHASTVVADTINADMPVCMLMHPIPMTMAVPSAAENEESTSMKTGVHAAMQ